MEIIWKTIGLFKPIGKYEIIKEGGGVDRDEKNSQWIPGLSKLLEDKKQ